MSRLRSMRYRLLAIAAVLVCLAAIFAPASRMQSTTCCSACFKRWQQCDANDVVCCQLYESCISQCPSTCPSCPK